MEDADYAPILQKLIAKSALPLSLVETEFAPDSTGFSVSRHVKWFNEKWPANRNLCGVAHFGDPTSHGEKRKSPSNPGRIQFRPVTTAGRFLAISFCRIGA